MTWRYVVAFVAALAVLAGCSGCSGHSDPSDALAGLRSFRIPSGAMENTLKVGDHVGVKEEAQPVRGSVVVFVGPDSWQDTPDAAGPKKDFVKRVIGLGGEHVVCCDAKGRITVDGQALDEPYLFPGDRASEISFDVKVPRDRLFVLGDHRMASADSRVHLSDGSNGTVPLANVIGVVVKVQAPDGRVSPLPTPQYDR